MHLFNVLKYPISNLPTAAELDALPHDLYMNWLIAAEWTRSANRADPKLISRYYRMDMPEQTKDYDIALLRKMISEYEPIQCTEVSN
jgi:hypothetical protein